MKIIVTRAGKFKNTTVVVEERSAARVVAELLERTRAAALAGQEAFDYQGHMFQLDQLVAPARLGQAVRQEQQVLVPSWGPHRSGIFTAPVVQSASEWLGGLSGAERGEPQSAGAPV